MIHIKQIINNLDYMPWGNTELYKFTDLLNYLNSINESEVIFDEDILLDPFYICNKKRYELYDFELSVRIGGCSIDECILGMAGKKSIDEVDFNIADKLRNRYVPVTEKKLPVSRFIEYINYIFNNEELIERMYDVFGEFYTENLYFEFF